MKKNKSLLLLLVFAIVISAVVTVSVSAADNGKNTEAPYEYVVVLGVDGMGNFSKKTDTPNIDAIFKGGATTDYALVENPSSSAEGWASLLIGVPCDVHGLTNYSIQEGAYTNDKLPTIFKLLKNQKPDAKAVSFCSWNYINKGIVENIDGVVKEGVADKDMGAKVESYVSENGVPNLLYCQFNNSDAVGHASGFGGAEHLQCITETDAYIGEVYNVYKDAGVLDKTLFIVTADHGGRSTTHGGWTDGEKYVFYGVAGKGVNETSELEMFIRDTPAIVCYALGLKGTEGWDSYIPKNLFTDNMNPLSRPASAPELICPSTTPGADSEKYIGNYIDITELRAGFFFDGDLSNFVSDSDVELGRYVGEFSQSKTGTIYYPGGLYSSGVKVSYEGYLASDDLKLDNNSFSIGLWVNLNNMTADEPIWSTKIWSRVDGISGSEQAGLMIRNYYKDTKHYLGYSIGSGAYSVDGVAQTPVHGNYNYDAKNFYEPNKWVHTLMVLDRASGTLNYYINFELARSVKLSNYAWFTEDYDIDPHDIFAIGQDATGAYGKALEGIVDDLLIWDSAVDANTVAGLKAYYYNASYDYDFSYSGEPVISTTPSNEVAVGEYFTNTDNTPYVKLEATVLGEKLNSSAKYEINNSFILSDYKNPKFYVIDFDISTASNYLPMNFVSVILGNSGTDSLESAYNRITADGVFVGSLDGYEITRTLSISPFDWQHITMVYDLVDGADGYPLYIYFNGDLISNSEWINASDRQNGKTPAAILKTQILAEQFVTNANNYATTLIANANSALYTDDEYGNLEAFFCSGASMLESNKIFDLTYGKDYVLPKPDNMYLSGGVAYREFADALSKGNGTIDLLHSDFHKTYTVSEPCTVNTNGYEFNYKTSSAVSFAKSTDNSGNDVYTFSANSPLYTITDSDGAVKRYYENQTFEDLLNLAANGSTIKLFTNAEITQDCSLSYKQVNVDLNGYTLTNSDGYIRLFPKASVDVYGGTIIDTAAKEFIYIGNTSSTAIASFTECNITADGKFAEIRTGTLDFTDCTYKQNSGNDFATVGSGGTQGDSATINIEDSTLDLGGARFIYAVRASSYPAAIHIDITINNSDIKTTSNLFYLQNTTKDDESTTDVIEGAEGSTTDIVIKGNSKISSSKLDGGELTVPKTTLTLGLGSSFKSEPTIKGATLLFSDGASTVSNNEGSEYPYTVSKALYTITSADGTVKEYGDVQTLEALLSAAANGSTIKLFTNIENSKVDLIFNNKMVDVDLNGYTLTNTGSIRLWGANAELNFYDGTIANLGSRELIYANNEVPGCVATFTDCTITSAAKLADLRQGTLKLIDCTYTQSGGNDFATVASAGKQGDYVLIEIDGCTMNLGSARFVYSVRVASYPAAAKITVLVNNSEIKTNAALFYFQNTTSDDESTTDVIEGAEGSTTDIVIKGNTKISCSQFESGGKTVPKTTLTLGLGSMFTVEPTISGITTAFSDGGSGISKTEGSEYPYAVTETSYLYSITAPDGTVTKYYEEMSLHRLVALALENNGSTITLYHDIDLSETTACYITKTLTIDLNGYEIRNTGERIRLESAGNLTLKNGTLNDCGGVDASGKYVSKDFIFISTAGTNKTKLLIDNCNLIGNGYILDLRAGDVTVKNSKYVQGTSEAGQFAYMMSSGKMASLTIEKCDIELSNSVFVRIKRTSSSYKTEAHATVTVSDSVIKTTSNLFDLQNTVSADVSSNAITFTGKNLLKFSSFDNGTCTVSNTVVSFEKGTKFSAIPTVAAGNITFTDGGTGIGESGDTTYPYEVFGKVYYTVTKNNGSVTNVYKISTLSELIALADSGSVIKLCENVEMSAEISLSNKNIEINLNNFTLTTSNQFRLAGNTLLYVHGGTVSQVGTANFVFVADGNNSSKLKVEKCSVNIKNSFANMRSGSVEIVDSECKNTSGNTFILSAAGSATNLTLNNSSFELGEALLASMERYYDGAATTTVTINNCTVVTESNLFTMTNNYSADISKIRISLTGDKTKLSYRSFDGDTCNVSNTIVTIGLGVKMNKLPSVAIGKIMLGDGAKGFAASGDSTYPYVVSNKSSLPAKTYLTLTLYSDFTINLCFLESEWDCIVKVVCDGNEIKPSKSNGMVYYPIKGIAPYNAADTKSITVTYKYQDITLDAVVECSVIAYAKRLLESDYSNESKALISRTVDYVKTVYEYAGFEIPTSVIDIISSDAYQAISTDGILSEIPQSSTSVGGISTVIESVQIELDSEFRFRFNIKSGVNTSLTVKTRTMNETFEIVNGMCGEKRYIIVNMRAFDMYDGVISFSTPDASGTYDFKAYANSPAHDKDTTGMTQKTLLSLYNYCKKASEYSKVQDQDFRSFASVVVKNGKSGTVTYVVDDGRADTAERLEPMLDEYENLKLTFALIATKYATLNTAYNETTEKYEYVLDSNGKYTYKVNEEAAAYWRELIDNYNGRVEYANHTFTHNFAGYDDEGGTVSYVNNNGEIVTVNLPVGSATAEVAAAIQVLNELFGVDVKTLVDPGFSANKTDVTIDGVTYPGYLAYYLEICRQLYEDGILIGSRGNGFAESMLNPSYVVTPEMFKDASARLNIISFTVKDFDSVESWKTYIDYATASGGWANFCIHQIFEDGTVSSAFHLKESQAKELFNYTNRDDVWVANYEEACKYYAEWSTSQVNAEYSNGKITVTLTDSENNEVYDEALTVKVTVPSSWSKCLVNGSTATVIMTDETGASYVYVDIVPDSGSVVLSEK